VALTGNSPMIVLTDIILLTHANAAFRSAGTAQIAPLSSDFEFGHRAAPARFAGPR
jgi:hypothetical protein